MPVEKFAADEAENSPSELNLLSEELPLGDLACIGQLVAGKLADVLVVHWKVEAVVLAAE